MRRLLVVEDNQQMCRLHERVLGGIYDLVVGEDGREAVEILSGEHSFDLVVLDGELPGLNGPDVVRAVRGAGCATPVVAVHGGQCSFAGCGVQAEMLKPFNVVRLRTVVASLLG